MERIAQIQALLNSVFTPLAVLMLTVIAIAYVLSPAIQEWMMERRGMMGRVIFGLLLFPAATAIVSLLA
jgi:uncharacterized membrane protein